MSYQLSDNGLKAIQEIGKWVMAAIAVALLWVQQHNQHAERVKIDRDAAIDNNTRLESIAKEVKATQRPLVFNEGK